MPRPHPRPIVYTVPEAARQLGRAIPRTYQQVRALELGFRTVGGDFILLEEHDLRKLSEHVPVVGRPRRKGA